MFSKIQLDIVRLEYTNKGEEEGKKRKLMAWIEVYGGQRSLAFELTTLYFEWKYIINVRLVPW